MKSLTSNILVAAAYLSLGFAVQPAWADPFSVTAEAAGVQNTTTQLSYSGVEGFDEQSTGYGETFTTSYGTTASSAVQMSGTYNGVQIASADQYGGAGGTGNYADTFTSTGYSLTLAATTTATGQAAPINYFGFWLSAVDPGNTVSFYNNGTLVYSFGAAQVQALLASSPAYLGNPNANFSGQNGGENYVFLNFYDLGGDFNQIVFAENPAWGGFESDNQTVGYDANVPEPPAYALFAAGLLALAWQARRRACPDSPKA